MLKPVRREKITVQEAYGKDDPRCITKSGAQRTAHVWRTVPAVYSPTPQQLHIVDALEIMEPLLFGEQEKGNQNLGFDLKTIAKYFPGREFPPGPHFELMIAMHIINENAHRSWDLEEFVETYLGHKYDKLGKKGVHNFGFSQAARYAEQDARFTWLLRNRALRLLRKHGLIPLFEFEMELFPILREQEMAGALIDRKRIDELKVDYERQLDDIFDQLVVDYGVSPDFNANSTPQKQELFYKKHKVVVTKKTESGQPSTDAEVLEKIAAGAFQHKVRDATGSYTVAEGTSDMPVAKIAQLMLNHAEVAKLLGTYIIGLGIRLDKNHLLHPSFTQHGTDTGRLSAREPNVHNIPRESDLRNIFIAPPGYKLIDIDYDQIELRLICWLAREKVMRDVFLNDEDIHFKTASLVLGIPESEISSELRTTRGKIPNFLISYGGTEYRLRLATGLPLETCKEIIDAYFAGYPALQPWKARLLRDAKERAQFSIVDGTRKMIVPPHVLTAMGRWRRLPELFTNPKDARDREEWKKLNGRLQHAERVAINFAVQGTAAEILKQAMIDVDTWQKRTRFPFQMVMNVHDEIIGYAPDAHADEALATVSELMSGVVNRVTGEPFLEGWVPLVASGKISERWSKG
jgi:DNA polymerase-1